MIAILDACTVFNLINLSGDDLYLNYTKKIFDEVKIVPVVFAELKNNSKDAMDPNSDNTIIEETVSRLVDYQVIKEDVKLSLKHFKERKEGKEDGEFVSVCCALELSRTINTDRNEFAKNLYSVYFITDDFPAKQEFDEYYRINQIGQIIDTLDLLTSFYLKGYIINKNHLIKQMGSLLSLYNRPLHNLIFKLKGAKKESLKPKLQLTISQLIHYLDEFSEASLNKIDILIRAPEFQSYLGKNKILKTSFDKLFLALLGNKSQYIRKRIELLDSVHNA